MLVVGTLVWIPFVMVANRQWDKEQAAAAA